MRTYCVHCRVAIVTQRGRAMHWPHTPRTRVAAYDCPLRERDGGPRGGPKA